LTLTVSHWTGEAWAYPVNAQSRSERLHIPGNSRGRESLLCASKAVLDGFKGALGFGLGSGSPPGYREGCTAHSTDTENPAKYRPHRPQGSKSAHLQGLCAGGIVCSYRP